MLSNTYILMAISTNRSLMLLLGTKQYLFELQTFFYFDGDGIFWKGRKGAPLVPRKLFVRCLSVCLIIIMCISL